MTKSVVVFLWIMMSALAQGNGIIMGPVSHLVLTDGYFLYDTLGSLAGPSVQIWASNFSVDETPLAIDTTIRTTGGNPGSAGGLYSLGGVATNLSYANPSGPLQQFTIYDGTTDTMHNYFAASECAGCNLSGVYRTGLDWTNPEYLFTAGSGTPDTDEVLGITYDPYTDTLWVADFVHLANREGTGTMVRNYSMAGTLLDSFSLGPDHYNNVALAFDPADQTLWLGRYQSQVLEQWSTTFGDHILLQTVTVTQLSTVNTIYGGEFAINADAPEPSSTVLAIVGLMIILLVRPYARSRVKK